MWDDAGKAGIGGALGDGEGRNRTGDTTVFSRVLYRLSYLARTAQSSRAKLGASAGARLGFMSA